MNVEPVRLEGRIVRVELLSVDHAPELWEVADPGLFPYMWTWADVSSVDAFRSNIKALLSIPDWCSFAIVSQETGKAIGTTSYLEIRPAHRGLEIGSTWIGRAYHGTLVNPENKYLLLRHAFETLGAIRVQLKTDGRNLHSQAAIAKLGAKLEGTLRKHVVMPDGFLRDTVMYSIIDDEWPGVKAGLEARLGYVP
ncbi:MAG TPA: GNAT family protein [Chloroflexia bacterium]|nr:GNAT family protein [Chloroflexia bacterium]